MQKGDPGLFRDRPEDSLAFRAKDLLGDGRSQINFKTFDLAGLDVGQAEQLGVWPDPPGYLLRLLGPGIAALLLAGTGS